MELPRFATVATEPRRMEEPSIELPPNATAHDLLRLVYRSADLPLTTRMRAAMAAIPYETPKLAVTALVQESDLATLLDRRLEKLKQMRNGNDAKLIEQPAIPKPIEAPVVEIKPTDVRSPPRSNDRRFRRF
jgi:hypothetical protein